MSTPFDAEYSRYQKRPAPGRASNDLAEPWVDALHRVDRLTSRELQVFRLLSGGITNQDMADRLFVSERTIRAHVKGVSGKLHLGTRLQLCLASHAYRYGCRVDGAQSTANC